MAARIRNSAVLSAIAVLAALAVAGGPPAEASRAASGAAHLSVSQPQQREVPGTGGITMRLGDGSRAVVDTRNGVARITAPDGTVTYRRVPSTGRTADAGSEVVAPDKAQLAALLKAPRREPYATDHIVVVFTEASGPTQDDFAPTPEVIAAYRRGGPAPEYTSDPATNRGLAEAGVVAESRLFSGHSRSELRRLTASTPAASPGLPLANAYRLTIDTGDPVSAARTILRLPGVQLAELDWAVEAPGATTALSATASAAAADAADSLARPGASAPSNKKPGGSLWDIANYGIASSAQSFWNTPGLDAVAAYDEIGDAFGEMPGTGQIITDVGIGDLTDDNPASRCYGSGFGPTTIVKGNQRYIDLPSMPLVPTYTASAKSRLDPLGEVCGTDPLLRSIGHELSVMAPLPHDLQRPENTGEGLTDLLGLAPGAEYRVVVPSSDQPDVSDVTAALLAAAFQSPRPDVITTGLTASGDSQGFPARYLEQDRLAEAMIRVIVNSLDIPVVVGAGDGVRRNSSIAAFGTSGGATAVNVVRLTESESGLDDIALSSAPSLLHDSGAIAVGASTENDVFADPPQGAAEIDAQRQQPFAATRWTGATDFASGYGTRIDLSAPGDSILSMSHLANGGATEAQPNLAEGTGISAAEVAAGVAIVARVAELTGQQFDTPRALRAYLQETSTRMRNVPQADRRIEIGGQLDLRRAVEKLLADAGNPAQLGIARFAIAQRRPVANLGATFETGTDPRLIDLQGPTSPITGALTGANLRAWITFAPDWEGIPDDATYALYVRGTDQHNHLLATTPSARLQPAQIFRAAGLPTHFHKRQTLEIEYLARFGGGRGASWTRPITFGPAPVTSQEVLAPRVAPVIHGRTVLVRYDLRGARDLQVPVTLGISYPGRANPATGAMYDFAETFELPYQRGDPSSRVGSVRIPVRDLQGAGLYGIGIHLRDEEVDGFVTPDYSDFAYTRVAGSSDDQPPAPLVSHPGSKPGHHVDLAYHGRLRVSFDVSDVPGADDAYLEVSAPGPASAVGVNTFNNPEGDIRDQNGVDTSSVMYYHAAAPRGSITVDPGSFGILATMTHGIRVLAASDGGVIGEASPVVTVTREGVKPVGNDPINESGFAVGSRSDVGLVATRAFDRRFDLDSTVQSFDTASKGIGSTLAQIDGGQTSYRMVGNAMFGDVGLFGEFDPFSPDDAVGYTAVVDGDSVAWTPPDPGALSVRGGGSDPDNPVGAFLAFDTSDGSPTAYRAFTSDVGADTFGPVFDVSGGLAGANVARLNQVVYDAGNGLGMAGFASNDLCPAPLLEEFDTSAQTATSVAGVGFGDPFSMAIDRTHGVVAVANSCSPDLGLYDLASGQASLVDLGQPGYYVAGDGDHDLILVAKAVPPDFLRNHVVQSSIAVYDSEGSYQKEITGVYLWDTPLVPGLDGLQVDPASRTAWIFGPFGRQLEPIDY